MILAPVPIHGASIMLGPTMTSRRWRRGNYSMIYGIMLPIFIGFTALSVDTSWQRISQSQAQDVADAAAYAWQLSCCLVTLLFAMFSWLIGPR